MIQTRVGQATALSCPPALSARARADRNGFNPSQAKSFDGNTSALVVPRTPRRTTAARTGLNHDRVPEGRDGTEGRPPSGGGHGVHALIAGLLVIAVLAASIALGGSIENAFDALAHLL